MIPKEVTGFLSFVPVPLCGYQTFFDEDIPRARRDAMDERVI
ncbi:MULTISPECIES: hypothetical protein [Rhodococcus]|uniref:Uncharacterized protein n=1 Tax=Rhodococcus globerulus TaxID=33008 RepID=A0ABU4BWJ3_RHOGO|nr:MULTISPECIES: hypothetical protein [Rhodococcus]MDV6268610.1 hypothetical protein [Rhodococcus globerulus]MDV8067330.1 hypothetical protein [Rhodococcus sp. IEGM 1366]